MVPGWFRPWELHSSSWIKHIWQVKYGQPDLCEQNWMLFCIHLTSMVTLPILQQQPLVRTSGHKGRLRFHQIPRLISGTTPVSPRLPSFQNRHGAKSAPCRPSAEPHLASCTANWSPTLLWYGLPNHPNQSNQVPTSTKTSFHHFALNLGTSPSETPAMPCSMGYFKDRIPRNFSARSPTKISPASPSTAPAMTRWCLGLAAMVDGETPNRDQFDQQFDHSTFQHLPTKEGCTNFTSWHHGNNPWWAKPGSVQNILSICLKCRSVR